jgi:hypothetical protein
LPLRKKGAVAQAKKNFCMDNHLQRSSLKKTILLKILMSTIKSSVAEPVPPGAKAVFMNYGSGPGSSLFFERLE